MSLVLKIMLILAVVLSLAAVITWAVTGFHFYTKYQVVERIEAEVDSDDPFAATGFYESATEIRTVLRDEFHLGLLPTPQGLFDKHVVSVLSIAVPAWASVGILAWLAGRRKRRLQADDAESRDSTTGKTQSPDI